MGSCDRDTERDLDGDEAFAAWCDARRDDAILDMDARATEAFGFPHDAGERVLDREAMDAMQGPAPRAAAGG